MTTSTIRRLGVALTCVLALAVAGLALLHARAGAARPAEPRADGTVEIDAATRRAGLRFADGVGPEDRRWILAAIDRARPHARRLIAEGDGLVEIFAFTDPRSLSGGGSALGITEAGPDGVRVGFDLPVLNGGRVSDRDSTVLHELGHVLDFTLVRDDVRGQMDRLIPTGGPCAASEHTTGSCAAPEERFADTFAKWSLHGAVSAFGAGYAVPTPASLEDWGAPLDRLALRLPPDAG
jgi:hypothetical protein